MLNCKICNKSIKNNTGLAKHIRSHGYFVIKDYYTEFISPQKFCIVCGAETKFMTLKDGFRDTCGISCSAIISKRRLKEDPIKYKKFKEKTSIAVKNEWATKDQTNRIINMTAQKQIVIDNLTVEERKNKFGWLNHLSIAEKEKFINDIMLKTGCHAWWKNASDEDKQIVYDKRTNTMMQANSSKNTEYYTYHLSNGGLFTSNKIMTDQMISDFENYTGLDIFFKNLGLPGINDV